ncbi:MAG: DUF1674 domain-containing protein [Hyphomicrobiales bacterium]|nr:DUF1674 domain-containing protein [Hyphomicrobiales bacterium]
MTDKNTDEGPARQHSANQTAPVVTERTEAVPDNPEGTDEVGGPKGPEPTRYGDWERKGRCVDF